MINGYLSVFGQRKSSVDFLAKVDRLSDTSGGIEGIRLGLINWLIKNDLAPSLIPPFELSFKKVWKETYKGLPLPSTLRKKRSSRSGSPNQYEDHHYGNLQLSHRVPPSDLARILRVDEGAIYHFRK
jgi:hypothetical protein